VKNLRRIVFLKKQKSSLAHRAVDNGETCEWEPFASLRVHNNVHGS